MDTSGNNQNNTPMQYGMTPVQYPQGPVLQKNSNKKAIIAIILIVIGMIVALTIALIYMFDPSTVSKKPGEYGCKLPEDEAMLNFGHCNVEDVNDHIARKNVFKLVAPDLSKCAPDEALHETNRAEWYSAWGRCLDDEFEPVIKAADGPKATGWASLVLVDSVETSGTTCTRSEVSSEQHEVAAFYCRKEAKAYFIKTHTGDIVRDLEVVFHEYGHHLQLLWGVQIDATLFINELYKNRKATTDESKETLLERDNRRRELSVSCMSSYLLNNSGIDGGRVRSFIGKIQKVEVNDSAAKTHGTARAQAYALNQGYSATSFEACNTWRWDDQTIDN